MLYVRGSEVQDFLRCRLRWHWAWREGLVSKRPNYKQLFGTAMHKFLESYYMFGASVAEDDMWNAAIEGGMLEMDEVERTELQDLLAEVSRHYVQFWSADDERWSVVATELTFAVPIAKGIRYTGTIDKVMIDDLNRVWFADYKTTSHIEKYDKNSDMDRQISRYWWALQQLAKGSGYILVGENWVPVRRHPIYGHLKDKEIHGFIYDIILRDYPTPPKVLKDGSLSKDKRQKTTYELYFNELKKRGLPESPEYKEILQYLADNPREYFRRQRVIRSQSEIVHAVLELLDVIKDMRHPRIYRNITNDCAWDCAFREICQASMDGSDVDFLIEQLYDRDPGKMA